MPEAPPLPPRGDALRRIFGRPHALIGMLHCPPLPGSPHYEQGSVAAVAEHAVHEAVIYRDAGFDGVLVENAWDVPFPKPGDHGPETPAAMAVVAWEVRRRTGLPVGVNMLANAVIPAIAVAHAAGAQFVRANQWVNAYVANEGIVEGPAPAATRYRAAIGARDVAVFADVRVKHGSHAIVADRPLVEQARDAQFFDADVLIATGARTGDPTPVAEVEALRRATGLPVLIGSGMDSAQAETLAAADGAIVGSSLKEGGAWWQPLDPARVEKLAAVAHEVWS